MDRIASTQVGDQVADNDTQSEPPAKARADTAPAPAVHLLVALRWPIAFVAVCVLAYLAYRDTLHRASNAAGRTAEAVVSAARGILSGNVTETFLSSIPEFDPDGSGNLEVATLTATETFTRSDERKILWDRFSLGVTTSQIRVPVTYRYHLRLDDAWHVEIDGALCRVVAPAVRPSLPPAIHTDRMEKLTQSDWLRFNGDDQMAVLERSITPTLTTYAADDRHLGLVRENARRAVEDFVKTWLLREGQWGAERVTVVQVAFADEEKGETGELPRSPLKLPEPDG